MKALLLKFVDLFNLYALFNRYTRNTGTIFMLHAMSSGKEGDTHGTTPQLLESFFDYLKRGGYRVMSLDQYVNALLNHESAYKVVVFTVDDGYRDFYLNAFKVFKQYGYGATIFLTSDFVDRKLFFWWDQIEFSINSTNKQNLALDFLANGALPLTNEAERSQAITTVTRHCKTLPNEKKLELLEELKTVLEVDLTGQPTGQYEPLKWSEIKEMNQHGIDFHPHTQTHPIMSKLTSEQKRTEVSQPKERIEQELSRPADIFCYPNGQWEDFDDEVIAELNRSGYKAAVTGMEGFDLTTNDNDMFRLRRWPIPSELKFFKQYVSGLEKFKSQVLGR